MKINLCLSPKNSFKKCYLDLKYILNRTDYTDPQKEESGLRDE